MVWLSFLASSAIVVLAAIKLAEYGDAISVRTKLGGMFVGVILMAGATSLPELLTTINSIQQNVPDLAAGNMFGSNMFNMFLLGFLDLLNRRARILRKVAHRHALSGSIASLLSALAIFFVLANI
ncbi:MAG: sodium:calcium antiporter, partial [Chloroflexi bacterium]|nr:sodium:calcium antiporter [Chloroflexota bacterium]